MKNADKIKLILPAAAYALCLAACGDVNTMTEAEGATSYDAVPSVTEANETVTSPVTSFTDLDDDEPYIILSQDPETGELERFEKDATGTEKITSSPSNQVIGSSQEDNGIIIITEETNENDLTGKGTTITDVVGESENFVVTDPWSGESMRVTAPPTRDPDIQQGNVQALTSGLTPTGASVEVKDGVTYVDGVVIVNKTYSLPQEYGNGLDPEAEAAFYEMAGAAADDGIWLYIVSGYRSYWYQDQLYWGYYSWRGEETDRFSAKAGHSEHQTGLAMDVNDATRNFVGTPEAKWLEEHCVEYGFIIRYPEDKEDATGFMYEPWHIRYLGKEKSKLIADSGLCLEEYYGLTSVYPPEETQDTDEPQG